LVPQHKQDAEPLMDEHAADTGSSSDLAYAYKPSLMGAPFEFRLTPTALAWTKGQYSNRVPYDQFRRVRLSYRPMTVQSHRFLAELWPANGPKLQVASTSVRGIVEQERHDHAYCAFVRELHRRIGATGAPTAFLVGSPALLYWPGVVVFVGASLALLVLSVRTLRGGELAGIALMLGFFALFLWQVGTFFRRNRPGTYRPDAIPAQVLP
jgi:hypothetical protein